MMNSKKRLRNALNEAMGSEFEPLQDVLFAQLQEALWRPKWRTSADLANLVAASIALLRDIRPKDAVEALLAVQMVSTHHAAMECSRRAMNQEQTFEGRNQNLKFAASFMTLYKSQMEALDKHRGKGQQKVTVEHVHIEAGAQAVVGTVHSGSTRPGDINASTHALAHNPGEVLKPAKAGEYAKSREKKRRRGRDA